MLIAIYPDYTASRRGKRVILSETFSDDFLSFFVSPYHHFWVCVVSHAIESN
jgi:hypothetical protein